MPVPDDAIAPELPEIAAFAYRAFGDLIHDHPITFSGLAPLTWATIDAYAWRVGIVRIDEFEMFVTFIRAIDDAWLAHAKVKQPDA